MKKVVFIADFFVEQVQGGGELVNEEIINMFARSGIDVHKINSQHVTTEFLNTHQESFFFVGNFIGLSEPCKLALQNHDYVIIEHDHKFLKTRDPSPFKGNPIPEDQIINHDFYRNAKAVLCQSKNHAETTHNTLLIDNVVNLECSIWSKEQLAAIRSAAMTPKTKKYAVLESPNKVKGTLQAKLLCGQKNIDYDLLPQMPFEDLMHRLSEYETLVFFSQVVETFCRLVVEARMLGCKLMTNKNNGCTSEEWFSQHNGVELIDFVEKKQVEVLDNILNIVQGGPINFFTSSKDNGKKTADITVILNSYRRPYNLQRQINAIKKQTIGCKQIWLWVNQHEDNKGYDYSGLGIDRIFNNDFNWKFYGRFAGALLADTEYIAIFDDDTIPGSEWFENCLDTMKEQEGIMGSAGVILNGNRYVEHDRCGWPTQNAEATEVDLVGHAWFFKREWLQYLWTEKPPTWDNGEDIQFSYAAQRYGGVKTFCPPHPADKPQMHGSIMGNELGIDSKATSNNNETTHQEFFSERDMCVQSSLAKGWRTVRGVKL